MTTTIIEQGALARFTREHSWESHTWRPGDTFTVSEYVSAEESEDGEAFYWGDGDGGFNNVTAPASHVERVKSAGEMRARRIPTPEEILAGLSVDLLASCDDFQVNEIDREGAEAEAYGRTHDGLPFGFIVKITHVWQCDE